MIVLCFLAPRARGSAARPGSRDAHLLRRGLSASAQREARQIGCPPVSVRVSMRAALAMQAGDARWDGMSDAPMESDGGEPIASGRPSRDSDDSELHAASGSRLAELIDGGGDPPGGPQGPRRRWRDAARHRRLWRGALGDVAEDGGGGEGGAQGGDAQPEAALPARARADGALPPPEHRAVPRLRRQPVCHRDGVPAEGRPPRVLALAPRAGGPQSFDLLGRAPRAGLPPQPAAAQDCAPRRQADERADDQLGHRQAHRLRPRPQARQPVRVRRARARRPLVRAARRRRRRPARRGRAAVDGRRADARRPFNDGSFRNMSTNIGTPRYSAPESHTDAYDEKVDIYSAAVTF